MDSLVDEHLSSFQILATINKVMNICMQIFVFLFLLSTHVEVGLLDCVLYLYFTFREIAKQICKVSVRYYFPTSSVLIL